MSVAVEAACDSEISQNESRLLGVLQGVSKILSCLKWKGPAFCSLVANLVKSLVKVIPSLTKFAGPLREMELKVTRKLLFVTLI